VAVLLPRYKSFLKQWQSLRQTFFFGYLENFSAFYRFRKMKGIQCYTVMISLRKSTFTFVKHFVIHNSFCHLWSYELINSRTNNSSYWKRELLSFTMRVLIFTKQICTKEIMSLRNHIKHKTFWLCHSWMANATLPHPSLWESVHLQAMPFSPYKGLHNLASTSLYYLCQHPISSGQIKLFQNIKQYKIKIKMCVII